MTAIRGGVGRVATAILLGTVVALAAQGTAAAPIRAAGAPPAPAFHSHPMITVPSAPGRSNAPANLGPASSENWAGYYRTGPADDFLAVTGCWTVPSVASAGSEDTYSADWIGIDGVNDNDLIQTGTEEDWLGGYAYYASWWEILPAGPVKIGYVNPDDTMCASIYTGQVNSMAGIEMTISITDESVPGDTFSQTVQYAGPRESAEWIMERACLAVDANGNCTSFGTLADTSPPTTFFPVSYNGGNSPALAGAEAVQMEVPVPLQVLAVPSGPNNDDDGFAIAYGSSPPPPPSNEPTPAVTAIFPPSGSVVGGQAVTLAGSGFEPGATVEFGSRSATVWFFTSPYQITVTTPSNTAGPVTVTVTNPSLRSWIGTSVYSYVSGGGYTLDGFGGVHPIGDSPQVATTGYWPGWNIARAIAIDPCVSSGQVAGWVMDGFGGLHPFAASGTPMPAAPATSGYWPGWSIANDFVAFCITVSGVQHAAGCVLDGFGGLHAWADSGAVLGDVPCSGSGYWPGWDIATKIAVVPGTDQGYVMDGFGGLHPFNGATPYSASGYWPGWRIANDVVATSNGGYTLDGFGGIHPFGSAPAISPTGYWPGWDIARAIDMAWSGGGAFTVDGFGGIHPAGAAYFDPSGYWPGWDIVADFAAAP